MEQSRLRELEEQCIQDCAPPCAAACPLHVDMRALAGAAAQGDFNAGLALLRKSVPFPEIIARVCDQPCREVCNRGKVGDSLRMRDLERACLAYGNAAAAPSPRLPSRAGRVAVVGSGLSGLGAACDLARKGYRVDLFETLDRPGGSLLRLTEEALPHAALERDLLLLERLGVQTHTGETFTPHMQGWDALFLGCGAGGAQAWDLKRTPDGSPQVDPLTFETSLPGVFAGGSLIHAPSPVASLSDGRRAAISIDRYLQRVSLSAARVNEGRYETRLYTNLEGISSAQEVAPADALLGYTAEEARREGERCIQCECMECVKACEYLRRYGAYPRKYIREMYNNLSIIMRARTSNQFINSCTLCGQCGTICPTGLDMGKVVLEVRQEMVQTGKMPVSAHDFALRDMDFSLSERFALVLQPDGGRAARRAFYPGCQLAAASPDAVLSVYRDLLKTDPATAIILGCCGAPAAWSGEEARFAEAGEMLRTGWEKLGRPSLVLACSTCRTMMGRVLPEAHTVPLWTTLLAEGFIPAGKFGPRGGAQGGPQGGSPFDLAIHDPCTSRHDLEWQDSARAVLEALGASYRELPAGRDLTECCGYGGVVWLANPGMASEIIKRRAGEDPAAYLTYCAMCRDQFAGAGKPAVHLLDLIYGQDPQALSRRRAPDYSQRHENRARLKQAVLKMMTGKENRMPEAYENLRVEIPAEVRARMEERLILVEDVLQVIAHAEASGERFLNRADGHYLACFKPNVITYWVEYTHNGLMYRVYDAYSHRMTVQTDASLRDAPGGS